MNIIFNTFLVLHIVGGSVGLITGTINIARSKGGKSHTLIGKMFSYCMLTAGVSSFVLSILHPNYFLFMVGVFSVYLVATGHRYMYLKKLANAQRPKMIDWVVTVAMVLASVIFIGLGVKHLVAGNTFGVVFIVFGALGGRLVKTDLDNFRGKVKARNYWLLA